MNGYLDFQLEQSLRRAGLAAKRSLTDRLNEIGFDVDRHQTSLDSGAETWM